MSAISKRLRLRRMLLSDSRLDRGRRRRDTERMGTTTNDDDVTLMTCGRGLAQHAAPPRQMAEMLAALAETLDLHREMLVLGDAHSQREDEVYASLAAQYRDVSERLQRAADDMAAQRDLPIGAHDEMKWSNRHVRSFERFVRAQSKLASLLRDDAERDEQMLASMTSAA